MNSPQTPVESLPSPTASWLSTHGRWFLTPLLLALPSLYWVVDGFERIVLLTLGRDQGIFQYVAWAVAHGARDYGEIRDVNGPLIHLVHLVFMALGGADESRFRFLDAAVNSLVFFAVGWSLPSLFVALPRPNMGARTTEARNTDARTPPWRPWAERAAWGLAMWTALGIQYLLYLYWDMAQRESFCDWFALLATAFLAVALAPEDDGDGSSTLRSAVSKTWKMALLHLAGALSLIPWFGKPTYAVFTVAHLATILVADEASLSRKSRLRAFCLGGLGGVATQVAYLAAFADVRAFLKAYLSDVPAMYRFIWPKGPQEIFAQNNNSTVAITGLALAGFALALIAEGLWPKRALAWALFPVCGLVNVLAQKKGFPYHFHPVTAGIVLVAVATVAWVSFRRNAKEDDASGTERMAPLVLALVGGLVAAREIQQSPHIQNVWILAQGETAELRESRDYLIRFRDKDFFPIELREAALYLQARTRGTDTVQLYGMDPYLLFLARRKSATPYIYAYDLNVDAALNGGFSLVPTFPQAERIRAMRNAHEADLLARLRMAPPAAFVFIDKSPLMSSEDAQEDFAVHCPETSEWVGKNYRNGATFGEVHVLLRSDLLEGVAEPSQ